MIHLLVEGSLCPTLVVHLTYIDTRCKEIQIASDGMRWDAETNLCV
jgi:hypothetical protein